MCLIGIYVKGEIAIAKSKHIENCPHCGGKSEIKVFRGMFIHGWVGCPVCGIYKNWNDDPEDAIKKWNMRATQDVA